MNSATQSYLADPNFKTALSQTVSRVFYDSNKDYKSLVYSKHHVLPSLQAITPTFHHSPQEGFRAYYLNPGTSTILYITPFFPRRKLSEHYFYFIVASIFELSEIVSADNFLSPDMITGAMGNFVIRHYKESYWRNGEDVSCQVTVVFGDGKEYEFRTSSYANKRTKARDAALARLGENEVITPSGRMTLIKYVKRGVNDACERESRSFASFLKPLL